MPKIEKIYVTAKCSDACHILYMDKDGNELGANSDYVPNFMPGEHCGDYVELEIDVNTGMILNWKKPTQAEMQKEIIKGE